MSRPPAPSRRRARSLGALVALVAIVLASTLGTAGPASADPPGEDSIGEVFPPSPPSPDDLIGDVTAANQAADSAAFEVLAATDAATQAAKLAIVVAAKRDAADRQERTAAAALSKAEATVAQEEQNLRGLSAQAYVSGGSSQLDGLDDLLDGDTTDRRGGASVMFDKVMRHQIDTVAAARRAQAEAERALVTAKQRLAEAQKAADDAAAASKDRDRIKADAEAKRTKALAEQAAAKQRLRAAGLRGAGPIPLDLPLQGLPKLDADDLAGWFATSPYRPLVSTPITDYAKWFIEEGRMEGIRGDVAFAQAVLETGGFSNHDSVAYNNFSGIGHCDTCDGGWAFPSPQMGVRAQIQLLKSYAVKKPTYVNPLVDKRLRGPAGCCPTWNELTTVWATDPGYGPAIMGIYQQIVSYALARHASMLG